MSMERRQSTITVALSNDFLISFSRIPKSIQGKVLDFVTKFRSNPHLPGINYEKIVNAKDPNMRSVRIDQQYRGIVLKPDAGNVYLLLWVDHHDKAYQWAENKTYRVHPETGSLQVIEIEEGSGEAEVTAESVESEALFKHIRDRHLLRLGVPEDRLSLVRSLKSPEALDAVADKFPQEAYEALFFLADGYDLEVVFREMDITGAPKTIDVHDFKTALGTSDSQRRFFVIEDELELEAILNAPLEKWRVFLHPSQRKLVENRWNGPVKVLGGAGTGKTVAAMHRARWLLRHVFTEPSDHILFTTFTRNLAADISDNLEKICSADLLRRIEVINLDRWVYHFLKRNEYDFEIAYDDRIGSLWEQALDSAPSELELGMTFYREEWERVVQPQGVLSLQDYIKTSRVGRGIPLNRNMRKLVWRVFEEYRMLLDENRLREADGAMRDACLIFEDKGERPPYRAVIVDEAQDMGPQAFKLIRKLAPEGPDDLFIVGDAHQRIYKHQVVLGHCGINVRGRSKKLRINYRTTEENRLWAVGLLKGLAVDDLDGEGDDQRGYKSLLHGVVPQVHTFTDMAAEVDFIVGYLRHRREQKDSLKEICLTARTKIQLDQYESVLKNNGIDVYRIQGHEPEDRNKEGLRTATMHRIKGLEFDRVVMAGINEGLLPYEHPLPFSDPTVLKDHEAKERCLLYVSATRAKKEVVVTCFGTPSPFLQALAWRRPFNGSASFDFMMTSELT